MNHVITGTSKKHRNSCCEYFIRTIMFLFDSYWYAMNVDAVLATLERSLSEISKIMLKSCMPDLENPQIVVK